MKTPGEGQGRDVLGQLAELARDSARPATPAALHRGLERVRARMEGDQARRRQSAARSVRPWWAVVGLAAASAVAVVVGVGKDPSGPRRETPPPALTYRIEGGSVVDGGYLRESGGAGVRLSFVDGTEFILPPGTRSRLRAIDAAGARIAIENGTASFRVAPAPALNRRWQVDVGPFLVTVKGTVFSVSWDAVVERFELKLQRGGVTVSGPVTGGEIALRAGQRLVVDLPRGEAVISEQKPERAPDPPLPAVEPAAPQSVPARQKKRASAALAGRLDGDHRWAEALAAGHLDRILTEAEGEGLRLTLENASSSDLLALADAARYRRRVDVAREALLAERRRFPDSPHALDAAFLLGLVEEASGRGLARAVEWYDEYLRRAPAGTYASEALGRKMTLTSKLEGAAQARPVAQEYLRRFPNGTYAGPAWAFVRAR